MEKSNELIEAINYVQSKLELIPAFGDGIGDKVSKAELGVALNKLKLAMQNVTFENRYVIIMKHSAIEDQAIAEQLADQGAEQRENLFGPFHG